MNLHLVITVDGFNARCIGPYGNHWIPTPSLNQLAARGTVFDFFLAESDDCHSNLGAMLSGQHFLSNLADQSSASTSQLPDSIDTWDLLITDDTEMDLAVLDHFQTVETIDLDIDEFPEHPLEMLLSASFSRLESIASDSAVGQQRIWIHSKGFFNPWQAPLESQNLFKDESDPEPVRFEEAPAIVLDEGFDPDERLAYLHAYAAEVVELDRCLGRFIEMISEVHEPSTLVVAGVRGFALGEHCEVGHCDHTFHAEKLHVPLIVVSHNQHPSRFRSVVGSHEFHGLITNAPLSAKKADDKHSLVISAGSGFARIQTRAWSFIHLLADNQLASEANGALYSKPGDYLEVNEVAEICPGVASVLKKELGNHLSAYAEGKIPKLAEEVDLMFDVVS